jgi:hypothetical protein
LWAPKVHFFTHPIQIVLKQGFLKILNKKLFTRKYTFVIICENMNSPEPPDRKSFVGEFEWSAIVGDPHVIGGVARGELESLGRDVREC